MQKGIELALALLSIVVLCAARSSIVSKGAGDFSTIMAGLNAATAGDTILVKNGIYNEFVKWPASGSVVNIRRSSYPRIYVIDNEGRLIMPGGRMAAGRFVVRH